MGALIIVLFLSIKTVPGLAERLISIGYLVACLAFLGLALVVLFFAIRYLARHITASPILPKVTPGSVQQSQRSLLGHASLATLCEWSLDRIRFELGEIDWYQFEKFCAALLTAEGYQVARMGGAQPDGGVDLVARTDGRAILVQCKHWKTWKIKESTIRELLGSMTHFRAAQGALYTLNGWTQPAERFAREHGIDLVDGGELAARAKRALSETQLDELLDSSVRHCPKCEAPMVLRTGNFKAFWGCSTYPRCRGTLRQAGAR